MSKVYGLAGVRIGWLVARDPETVSALVEFKDYTTICSSAPSEVLALIGLRARAALVERHRARIARNLAALESFVARNGERFALAPPRAGSVCLLRLHQGHATDFCRCLVDKAGIMLLPSSVFQFGDEHVRVGLGRENLPDVLARLDTALSDREL
jgi:aspartate/methionine/tyrosine aminotransferase